MGGKMGTLPELLMLEERGHDGDVWDTRGLPCCESGYGQGERRSPLLQ